MRGQAFDIAVSSDLSRAYDTARAIRGELPVERDERWREFAFGQWEGLTWDEIVERWPYLAERSGTAARLYAPQGGETFEALCERVHRAIGDLRSGGYGNVLVVTHAGPLHAMLHAFFGEREGEMQEALSVRFSPGSITRVRLEKGRAELLALNEVPPGGILSAQ